MEEFVLALPGWATVDRTFGDPSTLAISTRVQSASFNGRPWIFGDLSLLAGNRTWSSENAGVGGVDLVTTAIDARALVNASPTRSRPDLDALEDRDVYAELLGNRMEQISYSPWNRTAHILSEVFDAAFRDSLNIVVYRRADGSDRLVFRSIASPKLEGLTVVPGALDKALLSTARFVETVLAALGYSHWHPRSHT